MSAANLNVHKKKKRNVFVPSKKEKNRNEQCKNKNRKNYSTAIIFLPFSCETRQVGFIDFNPFPWMESILLSLWFRSRGSILKNFYDVNILFGTV